jgi:hypothetical protein
MYPWPLKTARSQFWLLDKDKLHAVYATLGFRNMQDAVVMIILL